MSNELIDLENRLRNVIVNTCNKIGCKNCDLKWEDENGIMIGCSSTELEKRIHAIEIQP